MMHWETITTDYLDRHNDHIQIFMQHMGHGKFLLTDYGHTLRDFEYSGLSPTDYRNSIKGLLDRIGVELEGKALKVSATSERLDEQKMKLIKAMVEIDRMALDRLRHSERDQE